MGTTIFTKGVWLLVPGILCVLLSAPVRAEVQTLSLPQIIEYSLQNNGDLKSFREEKGIRDAGKMKAGLLPNPTLEFDGGTGAMTGNSSDSSLSLGVSQEFLLAGKRGKRLAIAEGEMEMYFWQLADKERLLAGETKSAFYELIVAEKRLALSEDFISLNRTLLQVTRERLEAGEIPELVMNLAKVELARSAGKKLAIEKDLRQNRTKILHLMGLPLDEDPVLTGSLESARSLTKELAQLQRLAQENRPDIKALEAEKSKGGAEIILARTEGIPNLTAGLSVKHDTTSSVVDGTNDSSNIIGLKLSMPIPLFDHNQAGVQDAQSKRNSAETRLSAAIKAIEREVETAYAGFVNAESILAMYRTDILPQLEENLKLTQEAYRLGEVGILTVIEEQKKYFEVNDGYLTALYDRQTALSKLETSVATDITGGVQ